MKSLTIDQMMPSDGEHVLEIYRLGLATGQATFEAQVPTWEEWDSNHLVVCRLVARLSDCIVGWAALSLVSKRPVYAGVAEVSIYIHENYRGKGIGTQLLTRLIELSEQNRIWTLQSSTFPENIASIALHKKCGFRLVGRRQKIARHKGVWRDTVILERRSKVTGID